MKKVLMWVLGILIGLAVIALIVGAGFLVTRRIGGVAWMNGSRLTMRGDYYRNAPGRALPSQPNRSQMMPRMFEQNEMPMYYYGRAGFRPFGGLMFIGGLIGGLFKLALLGLVIFFAATFALRHDRNRQAATLTATASPITPCPQCGHEIQSEWKHCPYCGTSLEASQSESPAT